MYWYLSFLRPPPVSTPISTGSITITPQIANDLRTELLFEPQDISYSWQRISPSIDQPLPNAETISWNPPESTYRPVSVPLPSSAKPGESWRIGLHVGPSRSHHITHYVEDTPGIIPVWSEGISLVRGEPSRSSNGAGTVRGVGGDSSNSKKGDKKGKSRATAGAKDEEGKKQGRIVREWKLSSEERLRIVEQTSFDLDKKIWDSGLALSAWFWKHLEVNHTHAQTKEVFDLLRMKEMLKVVEIGSGTGLVSIALDLALRKRANTSQSVEITATDLDSAIELMNENLALNSSRRPEQEHIATSAKVLDWDQPLPSWVEGPWPDLIIAADVTYNTASFPALHSTLANLLKPSSGETPTLVLAYKQRDPAERELWDLLEESGIDMVKVDQIQGSEEEGQVEIWIGKAS